MGIATAIWSHVYSGDEQAWIVLYDAIQAEMIRAAKNES
jgi:hypothetical protein